MSPSRRRPLLPPAALPLAALLLVLLLLPGCTGTTHPAPGDWDSPPSDTVTDTAADTDCFRDLDQDGYGDPDAAIACGGAASTDGTDCDDSASTVNPGANETCNEVDDDCDSLVDDDPVDGLPFYEDADGDGYGTNVTTACAITDGYSLAGSDCDDMDPAIHPGATEVCDTIDDDCDGIASDSLGSTSACPASTCLDAAQNGVTDDGVTWITLPFGETAPVWCDQTTDGGGWTLAFVRNTASTDSQANFGEGNVSTEALADSPANASGSSGAAMGWLDLNAYSYETLRLAAYSNSSETYLSSDIPRSELRIAFGDDGYQLYGGTTGYYWCGGDHNYTDYGVGAVSNPAGAPLDCKGHGSLGSGWDFSQSPYANAGLTLCGGDGSYFLSASWAGTYSYYGAAGGAQAIWVR